MWFLKSLSELQWNCPEESLNLLPLSSLFIQFSAFCTLLRNIVLFLSRNTEAISCLFDVTKKKASDKICKILHGFFRKDYFGDRKKDVVFLFKLKIISLSLFKYDLCSVLWRRVRDAMLWSRGAAFRTGCYNKMDNAKAYDQKEIPWICCLLSWNEFKIQILSELYVFTKFSLW